MVVQRGDDVRGEESHREQSTRSTEVRSKDCGNSQSVLPYFRTSVILLHMRSLTDPLGARRRHHPQPRGARSARGDRQLVRAPAGQAPRRRARGVGDGLELRVKYGDKRTHREFLRIHPERAPGLDPAVRPRPRGDAHRGRARGARSGADLIDINMGCPVARSCKTGRRRRAARRPRHRRVAIARRRARGQRPAGHGQAALRQLGRASAAASSWRAGSWTRPASPASASTRVMPRSSTRASPTTPWPPSSSSRSTCRCSLTGGLRDERRTPEAFERTRRRGRDARARLARQPVAASSSCSAERDGEPPRRGRRASSLWVIDRAEEHLGVERARPLPAQVLSLVRETMGLPKRAKQALVTAPTTADARCGRGPCRAHGSAHRRLTSAVLRPRPRPWKVAPRC